MHEFQMLFDEVVVGIRSTFSGPEKRIIVRERGEEDSEEEAYSCDVSIGELFNRALWGETYDR